MQVMGRQLKWLVIVAQPSNGRLYCLDTEGNIEEQYYHSGCNCSSLKACVKQPSDVVLYLILVMLVYLLFQCLNNI